MKPLNESYLTKTFRLLQFKQGKLYSSSFALVSSKIHSRGYPQLFILTPNQTATLLSIQSTNPNAVILFDIKFYSPSPSSTSSPSIERIYSNG